MTTPLLALLVAAVGALCLGLGQMGGEAADRARAQTAADAAALAGAAAGEGAARALATANGAQLLSFHREDRSVRVTVRYDDQPAEAKAVADYSPTAPGGL